MQWYVYYESRTDNSIRSYNIFDHYSFTEDCTKAVKKYRLQENGRQIIEEKIRGSLFYYFGSKYEWETVFYDPADEAEKGCKTDVCRQVMMNREAFMEYFFAHMDEFTKRRRKK